MNPWYKAKDKLPDVGEIVEIVLPYPNTCDVIRRGKRAIPNLANGWILEYYEGNYNVFRPYEGSAWRYLSENSEPRAVDLTRPYRTISGLEVRIYNTQGGSPGFPLLHGAYKENGHWFMHEWALSGVSFTNKQLQLVNVPEKGKVKVWVMKNPEGKLWVASKGDIRGDSVLFATKEIEVTEGEGL